MKVQVLYRTSPEEKQTKKQLKGCNITDQFMAMTGKCASFCYLPNDVNTLVKEKKSYL